MHKFRNINIFVYLAAITLTITAYAPDVRADVVTFSFTGNVTSGPFVGTTGYGTFTYDPATLALCAVPTNGFFATPGIGSFAVSFTIFGQTFTTTDDIDFPLRPYFQTNAEGVPIILDFAISEAGNQGLLGSAGNPTSINEPGVLMIFMSNLSPSADGKKFETEVSVTAVPEPGSILLLGTSLAGIAAGLRRRRKVRRPTN